MPKAFDDKEKEVITNALLKNGRELFGTHGIKKTSIADLAKATGIAQGSFYSFFTSKEELFFALIEQEEKRIQSSLAQFLTGDLTRDKLRMLLLNGLYEAETNTIIRQMLDPEIYQRIVRKLSEEKVRRHIDRDNADLEPLIKHWQSAGHMAGYKPSVISGMLRGVFTIALHRKEIGGDIFPEVLELLANTIATGLVREGQCCSD